MKSILLSYINKDYALNAPFIKVSESSVVALQTLRKSVQIAFYMRYTSFRILWGALQYHTIKKWWWFRYIISFIAFITIQQHDIYASQCVCLTIFCQNVSLKRIKSQPFDFFFWWHSVVVALFSSESLLFKQKLFSLNFCSNIAQTTINYFLRRKKMEEKFA